MAAARGRRDAHVGDGTTKRSIDLPGQRVDDVPSGMFEHDGWVYYADTGPAWVERRGNHAATDGVNRLALS